MNMRFPGRRRGRCHTTRIVHRPLKSPKSFTAGKIGMCAVFGRPVYTQRANVGEGLLGARPDYSVEKAFNETEFLKLS